MTKLRKADSSKRRSHLNVTYYGYLVVAALVIALMPDVSFAEEITLTTILPSQDSVRSKRGAIGNNYRELSNADIGDNNLLIEGRVGIGTTSPGTKLDVIGEIGAGLGDQTKAYLGAYSPNTVVGQLYLGSNIYWDDANSVWAKHYPSNASWRWLFNNAVGSANEGWSFAGLAYFPANVSATASPIEIFGIDENGNVGIGTTEPETMLTIQGEGEMGVIGDWKDKGLLIGWDTDNVFFGLKDEGSDRKDAVIAWGDNGAAGAGAGVADNLRFILKDSGAGGQDYEYMRIAYNGNVGIGTTEPQTKATGSGYLDAKDVWLRDANAGAGGWASAAATNIPRMTTGTYIGNGTQNRAILHELGVIPKLIMLQSIDGRGECGTYTSSSGRWFLWSGEEVDVTDADETYFYVGRAADGGNGNWASGNTYHWVAFGS